MIRWLKERFGKQHQTVVTHQFEPGERLSKLEKSIGLPIPSQHAHHFERALRHRSIVDNNKYEAHETYERLEFLGDAILDLIVTEILFEKYPRQNEGFLTKLRSKIVKGDTLYLLARKLELNKVLEVGDRASGQGIELSKSVLADVYEAVIAAIYLAHGYERTFRFVEKNLDEFLDLKTIETKIDNYKSVLMEYSQSERISLPVYKVISEDGPGHDKTFSVAVYLEGELKGEGSGKSKKQAEQIAAKNALDSLGLNNP
jgi:ribonuclease III